MPQRLPGSVDSRDKPQNRGAEFFIQEDGSYFPVTSALEKRYDGLVDKDSPALVEIGPVVNVQFEVNKLAIFRWHTRVYRFRSGLGTRPKSTR